MEINSTAMKASFTTLTGKKITVEYEDWHTVLNIKEKIQELEGIPPLQQRLAYEGHMLWDDDAVFFDAIKLIQTAEEELTDQSPGSIVNLHLILRLRGGANVIAPKQDQIRFNSPSGSDDDDDSCNSDDDNDSSNSRSEHELQQNGSRGSRRFITSKL